MTKAFALIVPLLLLSAGCSGANGTATPTSPPPSASPTPSISPEVKPDILLVLTDDQGWGDWEGANNAVIQTPAMSRLAAQGASFTDFHVAPVCSPTRASLLSGRHALETGVWGVTRGGERMRPDVETLAEALRNQGYRTGIFGKWHNGDSPPYDPPSQGFERFYGFTTGHLTDYFDPVLHDDGVPTQTRGYVTSLVTDAALDWLGEDTAQPTFTYVAYNTPHSPFEVEQRYVELYAGSGLPLVTQVIYAMITQTDEQFGRLLDAVDDDTIVIFVGDNGPARPGGAMRFTDGLAGQKGSVLFGGTQVPMLMRWPGTTAPGSTIDAPAQGQDVFPTLVRAAGGRPNAEVDGVDLAPLFAGGDLAERTLFTHHTNVLLGPDTTPVEVDPGAARRGRFSAVIDPGGTWSLYADRAQSVDVKTEHPEVFARLQSEYLSWFAQVSDGAGVALPTVIRGAAVDLPAHNGTPSGGAAFNGRWGWANDWIVSDDQGAITWPVDADGGTYWLDVAYAGEGRLAAGGERFALPAAKAPLSRPAPGHRRIVFTGEALSRNWPVHRVGPVHLPEGRSTWTVGLDGGIELKSIRLVPAP